MVVPSYSTGKTRTLRVPRLLFHGVIIALLVISAVVLGFYLQSSYFRRTAIGLESSLEQTEARYTEFRAYAEMVQDGLMETAAQIYEELNETEYRANIELNRQARTHQTELEIIFDQIEEIERAIREMDEDRQTFIDGLSARGAVIPPVADLLDSLEQAQAQLRAHSRIHNPMLLQENPAPHGVTLLSASTTTNEACAAQVQAHLQIIMDELAVQRKLTDNALEYHARMDLYLRNFPTLWPIEGNISSGFGWRSNPFGGGGSEWHDGIDIPAPRGTEIHAAGGGVVLYAQWRNGYGNTVVICHGLGKVTLYAHTSRNLVEAGQQVQRGEVIALVGSTGRSTAPHLHYEVQIDGVAVNPMPFLNEHF